MNIVLLVGLISFFAGLGLALSYLDEKIQRHRRKKMFCDRFNRS